MKEIDRLPYARKQRILEQLKTNDFVKTEQLARDLNVSYMTVYRDIMELEHNGEVVRVHGGAKSLLQETEHSDAENSVGPLSAVLQAYGDLTIEERFRKEVKYKQAIAKAAAEFVNDGDIIALDPSTTLLHMCPHLMEKEIIVVTTSLSVALQFSASKSVTVIMCGGMVRRKSLNIVGPYLSSTLRHVNIDKCFVSSRAFNLKSGLTDMTIEESDAKRQLIDSSRELYVLVDNTKLNKEASFSVCGVDEIKTVITDSRAQKTPDNAQMLEACREAGCRVICAEAADN